MTKEFHLTDDPSAGPADVARYNDALDILTAYYGDMDQQRANDFYGSMLWCDPDRDAQAAAQAWIDGLR